MNHKVPPYINHNVTTEKVIINFYLIALALIINAFYKQGIIPFRANIINFQLLFKPILLPVLGYLIGNVIEIISSYIELHKITFKSLISSFIPLFGVYMALITAINTNSFLFVINCGIILLIYKLFSHKIRLNIICFSRLIGALTLILFNNYSYLNQYEQLKTLSLSPLSIVTNGLGSSIGASNIILLVLIFIILFRTAIYKRKLPLIIIGSYLITTLIIYIITKSPLVFNNILNSELILISVLIAPLPQFSPYTKKGIITFGVLIGIIGGLIVNNFSTHEGLYLTVCGLSIFSNYFDLLMSKNKFKKEAIS